MKIGLFKHVISPGKNHSKVTRLPDFDACPMMVFNCHQSIHQSFTNKKTFITIPFFFSQLTTIIFHISVYFPGFFGSVFLLL